MKPDQYQIQINESEQDDCETMFDPASIKFKTQPGKTYTVEQVKAFSDKIVGKVVSGLKTPIFNATVSIDNEYVGQTDPNGNYFFKRKDLKGKDKMTVFAKHPEYLFESKSIAIDKETTNLPDLEPIANYICG